MEKNALTTNPHDDFPNPTWLERFSERYANGYPLRALMPLLALVGPQGALLAGSLDTMLAALGTKYSRERVNNFMDELFNRLEWVPSREDLTAMETPEELYDLFVLVIENVTKTRSKKKHIHYANLVAGQFMDRQPWDETETFVRMLNELTETHIQILHEATRETISYQGEPPTFKVITIRVEGKYLTRPGVIDLCDGLADVQTCVLEGYCADLVSRNLLRPIGSEALYPLRSFAITQYGLWFIQRISDKQELDVSRVTED